MPTLALTVRDYNDLRVRAAVLAHEIGGTPTPFSGPARNGNPARVPRYRVPSEPPSRTPENRGVAIQFSVTPGLLAHRRRGPGRPRLPEQERRQRSHERHRARQRAYRVRRAAGRPGGTGSRELRLSVELVG